MLLEFQNKTNSVFIEFQLIHFRFALELSDIDLRNIDLLDTHFHLLSPDKYTDIPSNYFFLSR